MDLTLFCFGTEGNINWISVPSPPLLAPAGGPAATSFFLGVYALSPFGSLSWLTMITFIKSRMQVSELPSSWLAFFGILGLPISFWAGFYGDLELAPLF